MTSTDTSAAEAASREAFEQWKKGPHGLGLGLSRNNTPGSDLDGYQDFFSQGQWDAWQAADSRMQAKIEALESAAIAWWESHRPIAYSEADHVKNKHVNINGQARLDLATIVADIVAARAAITQEQS